MVSSSRSWLLWVCVHLGLGLLWISLLANQAAPSGRPWSNPSEVALMLILAGWLPSLALACWQVQRRNWVSLLASDLLAAGLLIGIALTFYLPLFFWNVVWFFPLALLPRGVLTHLLLDH